MIIVDKLFPAKELGIIAASFVHESVTALPFEFGFDWFETMENRISFFHEIVDKDQKPSFSGFYASPPLATRKSSAKTGVSFANVFVWPRFLISYLQT